MIPLKDRNPTQRTAYVTVLLLIANIGVFIFLQRPHSSTAQDDLRFSVQYAAIPCELTTGEPISFAEFNQRRCLDNDDFDRAFPDKNVWLAAVFSMFLHGGWLHLGGNMLFLWVFGNNIEDKLGPIPYLGFYLAGGVVATIAHVMVDPSSTVPVIGASGAIAGVMGAYLVWFPRARIVTLFIVFFFFVSEISAAWLLGIWFVLQFFTGPDSGVAWMAHVGGFVFGVLVGLLLRDKARARQTVEWQYWQAHPPQRRFGGRDR